MMAESNTAEREITTVLCTTTETKVEENAETVIEMGILSKQVEEIISLSPDELKEEIIIDVSDEQNNKGSVDSQPEKTVESIDIEPEVTGDNFEISLEKTEKNIEIQHKKSDRGIEIQPEKIKEATEIPPKPADENIEIQSDKTGENFDIRPEKVEENVEIQSDKTKDTIKIPPIASEENTEIQSDEMEENSEIQSSKTETENIESQPEKTKENIIEIQSDKMGCNIEIHLENTDADIETKPDEKTEKEDIKLLSEKTEENKAHLPAPSTASATTSMTTSASTNTISKSFHPAGNPNLDRVDEKLYLGNLKAATDIPLLKKYEIKYILTVDSYPLPPSITDLPFLKAKYIQVCDIPKENILNHFQDSFNFLENAINSSPHREGGGGGGGGGGNILVHCNVGVSRSATIVLAYMMRKYHMTLEEAQDKLRSRRSVIGPNTGFISQLKLYEKMNYTIDPQNQFYKRFRLHVAADKIKSAKVLAPPYTDVIKKDPGVCTVRPEPVVYQCRKCRRILASASNLITHREKNSSHWYDFDFEGCGAVKSVVGSNSNSALKTSTISSTTKSKNIDNDKEDNERQLLANAAVHMAPPKIVSVGGGGGGDSENKGPVCTQMIFIEPISWMTNVSVSPNGKLHCPNVNCKSKLGSFSWVMNCVCPCGAKIQPAFYLVPSKVDRSTSRLNLQITI